MSVKSTQTSTLVWDYSSRDAGLAKLYESAKSAQWNASKDIDWSTAVPFGEPLADDSGFAMASFSSSPLARRGRSAWDEFRWELQAWMVSQFLHGEQGALVVAARLVEVMPDLDSKLYAASQAVDEARHVEAFSRYQAEKVPHPYPIAEPLESLLGDIIADPRWDITALGMQIMVEALAMAAFRLANSTFHDELIREITRLVARDEARHVSFGVLSLQGIYDEMTSAERRDREDMVLDAAELMRRRFLLAQVWERMDVPVADGTEYAATDPLMIQYRQAIFAKIVSSLVRIGLMTPRVRTGFESLQLIGGSADRSFALAKRMGAGGRRVPSPVGTGDRALDRADLPSRAGRDP